jgi:thiol-disulfide isomerase/thioredoxin
MKKLIFLIIILYCSLMPVSASEKQSFALKDMQEIDHVLPQYKGKWVLVNYWSPTCPPCLEEMPELVALYDARKNADLMIIGVAFDYASPQIVKAFVEDNLVSYPIVLGDEKVTAQIGPADVFPTTFFITRAVN